MDKKDKKELTFYSLCLAGSVLLFAGTIGYCFSSKEYEELNSKLSKETNQLIYNIQSIDLELDEDQYLFNINAAKDSSTITASYSISKEDFFDYYSKYSSHSNVSKGKFGNDTKENKEQISDISYIIDNYEPTVYIDGKEISNAKTYLSTDYCLSNPIEL